jgi:hypothetical protein
VDAAQHGAGEAGGQARSPELVDGGVNQTRVRPEARTDRRPRDMVISMLVLLLPIAILFAAHRLLLGGDQPAVVETQPAIAGARSAGAFPVAEPAVGPDQGWRPIRSGFRRVDDGATLRIGYVSPAGAGVQLVQSSVPADRLIPAELTADARPAEPTEINGRQWRWYAARPGEQALVLLEPERGILVVGAADRHELTALAASLP